MGSYKLVQDILENGVETATETNGASNVQDNYENSVDAIDESVTEPNRTNGCKETNFFEGVEKLLEVWFTGSRKGDAEESDLRNIPRYIMIRRRGTRSVPRSCITIVNSQILTGTYRQHSRRENKATGLRIDILGKHKHPCTT